MEVGLVGVPAGRGDLAGGAARAAWSKRISMAARFGVRPTWAVKRDHSRLRLHPQDAASSPTRTRPRRATMASQTAATSGDMGGAPAERSARNASVSARRSRHVVASVNRSRSRASCRPHRSPRQASDPLSSRGGTPRTAWAARGERRNSTHSTRSPRMRTAPGDSGARMLRMGRCPVALSTANGSSPRPMTTITAGWGRTRRSNPAAARSRKPAIRTPSSDAPAGGRATSHPSSVRRSVGPCGGPES